MKEKYSMMGIRTISKQWLCHFSFFFILCSFILFSCSIEDFEALRPTAKKLDSVTVTFNAYGGTPAPAPQTLNPGGKVVQPVGVTNGIQALAGWFKEANYANRWDFLTDTVSANMVLHARWVTSNAAYTVIYNTNGGSPASDSPITVSYGDKLREPAAMSREGYIFDGWYREEAFANRWNFAERTVDGNMQLYAKWNPISYTVAYDKNSAAATGTMPDSSHVYDIAKNISANVFARTGYEFAGWAKTQDGAVEFADGESVSNLASADGATVTLYARWGSFSYTVRYDANGGSGAMENSTFTYDVPQVLRPNAFARSGYTFAGWSKTEGGAVEFADGQSVSNLTETAHATVALYAVWKENFIVTFHKNNADSGSTDASPQSLTVVYPATTTGSLPAPPTRPHYTISGWNTRADGTGMTFTPATAVTATMTVYAQWAGMTYTVTFNKNNTDTGSTEATPQAKTVTRPTTTVDSLPTSPTRTGWEFSGWNTKADGSGTVFTADTTVTGDITIFAQWATMTVTFDRNGGDSEAAPRTMTITPPATSLGSLPTPPTRAGYAFDGWSVQESGSGTAFTAGTTVTGNTTVYAQWAPATVTFDKNGGNADASPKTMTVPVPATSLGSLPAEPMRPHYTFSGWNTKADGSGTMFSASTAIIGNITVYAKWTGAVYTVTFDNNGGDTEASPNIKTATYPVINIDSLPAPPTKAYFSFNGWNTEADGSGIAFTASSMVTGNTTVYAQWIPAAVTFNKNNADTGSTDANPAVKPLAPPATSLGSLPAEPTRPHYTFSGWNTKADGSGTMFSESTAVPGNITVYAQWAGLTYTVTFDKNGGDTDASPNIKTVTYPVTNIDSLPAPPIRAGWLFGGWNTRDDGTGTAFTESTTVTGTITLYARWWVLPPVTSPNGIELVWIPAGTFTMGSPGTELGRYSSETQHEVTLTAGFYMGKYQVTQAQYKAVMEDANPSYFSGDNRPVETVSWYEAIVFCNTLSVQEGFTPAYSISGSANPAAWGTIPSNYYDPLRAIWDTVTIVPESTGYRLPTEAQWEYACRAGTVTAFNWGSNYIDDTKARYDASYVDENNLEIGAYIYGTADVGSYAPNAWGLYDMHGNVFDWCWDWYEEYSSSAVEDPMGASDGSSRVFRGGFWGYYGQYLRSAYRDYNYPDSRGIGIGFRLLRP